mgnify:FL=1
MKIGSLKNFLHSLQKIKTPYRYANVVEVCKLIRGYASVTPANHVTSSSEATLLVLAGTPSNTSVLNQC